MFTTRAMSPSLLLLALACILLISGCKTVSAGPSIPQTVSEVRCKQPATAPVSKPPGDAGWVEWSAAEKAARLSENAVEWIAELIGTLTKERQYRKVEHACLDAAEKRGLIQQ